MLYVTILVIIALGYVLTRLYFLQKEIKRATRQLSDLNKDITDKKVDIRFFDRDIEKLAKEINNQIDLTKKAKAEKSLTENELKQAISYISHDIRTPMTSILGYMQLLESDEITPEIRKEYTSIVKNSAGRLKVLLEDFFELSIIAQADYPVKIEVIKLNHLIVEVLVAFYEEFNKGNIEPTITIPDHDIIITADPSAVKRVIENLVVNAIRHSSEHVTIQLEKLNTSILLTISNSVTQLSEQDLHHMFDRFYKADQTRTGKGTGLGLPIAKSLMGKMNGNLTAELIENQLFMKCEWKY
ncbi:HAMP domain-containing histidine kinase [Psychrobacillus psychrodurans]|uniref:sensor histidine kinase n=1 Tax=Psychrobacillus psychrodurans TaxID=126157 RepID=UPI0008E4E506|nr:HAMP domain-containing sensor histidine kinase [Psychrobacillus psychrodurans]MCK1997933.1 HAMP domain-containing histidine kinase [Psychrobacillus psychrodurans]MCZ8542506.1 HAMP domain-containing histidine kinase [Psychrobacillus psychrodurans]SFN27057.1 His Kinase A (phospho-acceptor) domain-containing protein [Psychrobacillus psychrodurans]